MPKRSANDFDGDFPNKRQRTSRGLEDIIEDIYTQVDFVNEDLPGSPKLNKAYLKSNFPKIQRSLSASNATALLDGVKAYLRDFKEGREKDVPGMIWRPVLTFLDNIGDLLDEYQAALLAKPPPSSYAKRLGWENAQQLPEPILCLRPSGKQGMPLVLMHRVFSHFQQHRTCDLPASHEGARALRVALGLCNCMGDAFKTENDRGNAFDHHMGAFLPKGSSEYEVPGGSTYARVDRVYAVDGTPLIIREDKNEYETGDAYFQVARSYDLVCERLSESDLRQGVPAFLLSVMGPSLTVSGGFKDGSCTIVEPLCAPLLMLQDKDNQRGRAIRLAQHLLALKDCLEILRKDASILRDVSGSSTLPFITGCPRVFSSFKDTAGKTHPVRFTKPLSGDHLLFAADAFAGDATRKAFVKIVYGSYGVEVHAVLSKAKMAPELFGTASMEGIEGGPMMVVMEMLDEDQWQVIYEFARGTQWEDAGVSSTIGGRLRAVVKMLGDNGLVHGDLRSNNIMVKKDGSESMLVDFDWAGEAGKVMYPLGRNEEITWPRPIGSPIGLGDDLVMLERLLKELSTS